jgi:hypothetical protein
VTTTVTRAAFALLAAALLSGCISAHSYVDPALPRADRQSVAAVSHPQPIQLLFEFRSRGRSNARATEATASRITAVAAQSGLFTEVSPVPVPSRRRLTIVIDNVPITSEEEAAERGFGTGLTFGLIGTMVTDGYVCEATLEEPGEAPLTLHFRHALHTTIGNASGPPGLTAVTPREGVNAVVDQLGWSIMRDLSRSARL